MSEWANVALIKKAKTLEGGLLVHSIKGLPFLLQEGMEVIFVPPQLKVPRKGRVESVEEKGEGTYLVAFSSVDSIDVSEQLVGCYCLVKKADLPDNYDKKSSLDLVGFTLKTADNTFVGTVDALEENPAHPLLVLHYEGRTIRVPLVDELVRSFNEQERVMVMDLPAGLLSL